MHSTALQSIQPRYRVQSIDLLRGLVMIIMALDHVRDYFHWSAQMYAPLDLAQTTVPIFLTRWITHFCAPVFMFLAGTSAFLVGQRKTKKQLSFFLFTRGLWLMFLDLTVIGLGWTFNIHFPSFFFDTLWALGVSMAVLSAFIYLPYKVILALGILIVVGHNLLDNIHVNGNNVPAFIWAELHDQRMFKFWGHTVATAYPVLPWIGIITLGYCFGAFL
jgi:Predicted membrane protein